MRPTASKIIRGRGISALRDRGGERSRSREELLAARGIFPLARNQLNEVEIADERSRLDGPNGKSFNRRSLLSRVRERAQCASQACSLAGWLAGCLLRRLRRNEATLLSRKTKEQRAAVAHPPSPFFHLLLKRPGCLSFSYYQAGSSPPLSFYLLLRSSCHYKRESCL